jgi:hypothetical protein
MNLKTKILSCVAALLLSFAVGRWAAPTKVVTETKTVEVEKKTDTVDRNKDTHKTTVTTTTERPDGTKETKTTVVEDTKSNTKKTDTDTNTITEDKIKTVERARDKVTLSVLGGISFGQAQTITYGGEISKPLLGPIRMGVFGLTSGTVGVSLGLDL